MRRAGVEHETSYATKSVRGRERYVLVVDDDEARADRFLRVLRSSSVRIATTGDDALRILRSPAPIELLITDLDPLGPFDGIGLARQARALHPEELRAAIDRAFEAVDQWTSS
jgi:CheY-like chemotaxis protein